MLKTGHFVIAPLAPLITAGRGLNCAKLLVWLHLEYQWRITSRRWVDVTNAEMKKWGVSRESKRTALRRLEALGLIEIERNGNRSPRVARR